MGKYKIKPRLETTPEDRYRKSKLDYLFYIANELADLVEATKLSGLQAKEANRLKRIEIKSFLESQGLTEEGIKKYELEDKA